MGINLIFTIEVIVQDLAALYEAARKQAIEDGLGEMDAYEEIIGKPESPNLECCLQMILDPGSIDGCSVLGSDASRF